MANVNAGGGRKVQAARDRWGGELDDGEGNGDDDLMSMLLAEKRARGAVAVSTTSADEYSPVSASAAASASSASTSAATGTETNMSSGRDGQVKKSSNFMHLAMADNNDDGDDDEIDYDDDHDDYSSAYTNKGAVVGSALTRQATTDTDYSFNSYGNDSNASGPNSLSPTKARGGGGGGGGGGGYTSALLLAPADDADGDMGEDETSYINYDDEDFEDFETGIL